MSTEKISSEVERAGVMSHVLKKLPKLHSIKLCKYKYKKPRGEVMNRSSDITNLI